MVFVVIRTKMILEMVTVATQMELLLNMIVSVTKSLLQMAIVPIMIVVMILVVVVGVQIPRGMIVFHLCLIGNV